MLISFRAPMIVFKLKTSLCRSIMRINWVSSHYSLSFYIKKLVEPVFTIYNRFHFCGILEQFARIPPVSLLFLFMQAVDFWETFFVTSSIRINFPNSDFLLLFVNLNVRNWSLHIIKNFLVHNDIFFSAITINSQLLGIRQPTLHSTDHFFIFFVSLESSCAY